MKMELIEGSETSAISTVTAGNYPPKNILHVPQFVSEAGCVIINRREHVRKYQIVKNIVM